MCLADTSVRGKKWQMALFQVDSYIAYLKWCRSFFYISLRSCFDCLKCSLRWKNLHFLPASSVRQHRCLPWKKRSNLKCFTLDPATSGIWLIFQPISSKLKFFTLNPAPSGILTFQPIPSKLKFFTLNPAPEPRAIELVRIAEVSSRGRACS